ncbi:MAG: hypothetical protein Q4E89_01790 [Eubacteriales bacterium]|nr:hypothetical protein [Eubacteriales bacterium]
MKNSSSRVRRYGKQPSCEWYCFLMIRMHYNSNVCFLCPAMNRWFNFLPAVYDIHG